MGRLGVVVASTLVSEDDQGALVGRVVDGRFRIEAPIATGGMGTVYRARQLNVERVVALKVLKSERRQDADAVAQFRREAGVIGQLTSPHTVGLIDVGALDDGDWFIAMDHLEGQTLRDRLAVEPLPVEEALGFADQIALSLAEAHARGIVHRDLKPANIFLAQTPAHVEVVKVLDFGIAVLVSTEGADARIAGTPRYMAPETLTGERPRPAADVYALGLVLYEMLAGTHPFEGYEGHDLLEAHLGEPCPPLPESVPAPVSALVARTLAKDPRLRPADGGAFRKALRQARGLPAEKPTKRVAGAPSAGAEDTLATKPSTLTVTLARMRAFVRPPPQAPWWRRWAPLALAVAVLAGAYLSRVSSPSRIVASLLTPRLTLAPLEVPPPTASSSPSPAEELVEIMVHTVPDGAAILVEGEARGETPQLLRLRRGVPVTLELRRRGFHPERVQLEPDANTRLRRRLRAVARPPAADPTAAKVDHYLD
jgi:tRNA A-37 threonylcarbamoyl transferase component Bud32